MPKRLTFTFSILNLGCPKNEVDGEKLAAALTQLGGRLCFSAEGADVAIVNTCGFIEPAKQESIDAVLDVARLREEGGCGAVVLVGCLGQRYAEQLRCELPEVDAVCGIDRTAACKAVIRVAAGLRGGDPPRSVERLCAGDTRLRLTPRHYAYLRLSEGCNNRCAYCAIPLIRGPLRSRRPESILREAEELVAHGARELILIAQDTTAYGTDRSGLPCLAELLRELGSLRKMRWLRLMYTHPAHWTEALAEEFGSNRRLLPYVDVPIQHASDAILRRMGRRVTQAQMRRLLSRLREAVPGLVLRTTVLVGFPGETAADFRRLGEFVDEMRFERLGAFSYCREEDTKAFGMRRQVAEPVKARRLNAIMRRQQRIAFEHAQSRVGESVLVVVDGRAQDGSGRWLARSYAEAPEVDPVVYLEASPGLRAGRFVKARVVSALGYDVQAKLQEG